MQRETTVGTDAAYSLLPFAVDHNLIFVTARDHSLMVVLEHVRRTLPEFNFGIWRHLHMNHHSQRGITRLAGRRKAEGCHGCVNKKRLKENGFQKKGKKDESKTVLKAAREYWRRACSEGMVEFTREQLLTSVFVCSNFTFYMDASFIF